MDYNGWTNYETWNIKLWLDNEPGTYEMQREWVEAVREQYADGQWKYELKELVKSYVEENNPLASEASMYADLLNAAISEANFYEIAEAILEDFPVEEEDEEETEEAADTVGQEG